MTMVTEISKFNEGINTDEVDILPVNTRVLVEWYDRNPYRKIEQTESGLILGLESTKLYKSHDTGEMEENDEIVACGKVLAVGPACKNVKVGEDIIAMKSYGTPIPFRKKGWMTLDEQTILCRITPHRCSAEPKKIRDEEIYSQDYIDFIKKNG